MIRMNKYLQQGMTFGEAAVARKKDREANAAANAAKKARKEAAAMTCQCCGRKIFAQRGKIAHHGYERPGYGWQTASCMGALYAPYEVARERLGDLVEALTNMLAVEKEKLAKIKAEKVKLPFSFNVQEEWVDKYGRKHKEKEVTEFASRAEYEAMLAEGGPACEAHWEKRNAAWAAGEKSYPDVYSKAMQVYLNHRTYDQMKASAVHAAEQTVKAISSDLKLASDRFSGWKQTHSGFDKATKEWIAK